MADDLVSIVVAAPRDRGHLGDCLQSLHAQSHERLELVVVGDRTFTGSLDEAAWHLKDASRSRFENIIVQPTDAFPGMHDLWNTGLSIANGRFVALVDADDVFDPRRIVRLLAALEGADAELAFSSIEPLRRPGPAPGCDAATQVPLPEDLLLPGIRQQLAIARDPTVGFALLRQDVALCPGNMLMTAALARRVGGFQGFRSRHGWDFLLQSLLHAEPVFVPEPLFGRRLKLSDGCPAERETANGDCDAVLRRFFAAVLSKPLANRLCPSPAYWPGFFEGFVWSAGHGESWRVASASVGGISTRDDGDFGPSPSTPTILTRIRES